MCAPNGSVLVGVTTPYPPTQLPILVHELLAMEIWREKVFPLMLEKTAKPRTSFPAYLVVCTMYYYLLAIAIATKVFIGNLLATRRVWVIIG